MPQGHKVLCMSSKKRNSARPKRLVWHYTSPDGLNGILEQDVLWATSAAFMNDIHELETGARALFKHFKKHRSKLPLDVAEKVEDEILKRTQNPHSAYIISASKDGDSLTLWRNYGKHSVSYAIGLDPSVPLIPLQISSAEEHPNPPVGWGREYIEDDEGQRHIVADPDHPVVECLRHKEKQWISVVYGGRRRRRIIESNFEDAIATATTTPKNGFLNFYFHWLSDLLLLKADGFRDEREVRINYTLVAPNWKFLCFRSTPWGVTPFIRLTSAPSSYNPAYSFGGSGDDFARVPASLPIVHIRIGPTPYRKAAKKALRQLLERHGYSHVRISASRIPYR